MAGPRWVRLDVDYFDNPKIIGLSSDAREMHLRSICWAQRHLSDGALPEGTAEGLGRAAGLSARRLADAADALVTHRLWLPTGEGFEIHDFLAMNPSRAQVEAEREATRERVRQLRARHR